MVVDDLFQRGLDEGLFSSDIDRDRAMALLVVGQGSTAWQLRVRSGTMPAAHAA